MRYSFAANGRLLVTAALWAAVAVSGQELTRTQISDTLFNANGSRAVGSLRISWKAFTAADGSTVAKNSVDLDIVDGIVSVALAPNLGVVPDGTYYSVDYRLHNGEKSNELWIVPESEAPVSIADIRVLSVPPAGMSVSLAQVIGLSAALDAKADKAAGNAAGDTFMAPHVIREDTPGTTNPLLGLQKHDGSAGVYFRAPELFGDVTYTLPPNAGAPNQALTTDGSGILFWSSASGSGGGAGSGSAYEVLQRGGTSITQRAVANFTSGFLVSDNTDQLRTEITPDFGTAAGTITQGNDSRLSNARTPLAHASTHAAAGSDPVTPAAIGALNRTNDSMLGMSPATPVLRLQGSAGQSAPLQEWRDANGALAALITAQGNGFFREVGISAPTGGTTVSQFFEVSGLKKFALSATDGVFDILRYDNAGAFLDRPLRIFRGGQIETTVSMKVADAGIGSGSLGLTGNYVELQGVSAPSDPSSGFGRLFLDSTTGELSLKKSTGSIVSLEGGGGGGGGSGDEVTVNASAVDTTANLADTSTVAWTVVDGGGGGPDEVQASIVPDSIGPTQIDETGTYDFSLGAVKLPSGTMFGSGTTPFNMTGYTDDVVPSAPETTNQFTAYWDRSSGLHCWILNGGSAQCSLTSAQIGTFAKLDALVADKALANLVDAQTFATGTKTVTAKFDFGGGSLEVPNGTTLPASCTVGMVFFDSDEAAGQNWNGCTATDTWTLLGSASGGAGQFSDLTDAGNTSSDPTAGKLLVADGDSFESVAVSGDAALDGAGALTLIADITRDSEWDTAAEINAATTDTDFLTLSAQNAGTDYTADLEEETHASEHGAGAADEILVEDLGTACAKGLVGASNGAGGLDCTARHYYSTIVLANNAVNSGVYSARWPTLSTMFLVACYTTGGGTATIQIDERVGTTPFSSGTNVLTSSLNCSGTYNSTAAFSNAGLAALARNAITISASNSTGGLVVEMFATID